MRKSSTCWPGKKPNGCSTSSFHGCQQRYQGRDAHGPSCHRQADGASQFGADRRCKPLGREKGFNRNSRRRSDNRANLVGREDRRYFSKHVAGSTGRTYSTKTDEGHDGGGCSVHSNDWRTNPATNLNEVGNREAGFLWRILYRFAFPENAVRLTLVG
jgi:hypothetical protein